MTVLVVDLQHWLLPTGDLVPQARLAPHVAMIVECATSCVIDGMTAMICRHHGGRRHCPGRVCMTTRGDTIEWLCSACDDAGLVTGWPGTRWDLSEVVLAPEDEEHAVYLPLDELRAVRDLEGLLPTVRATLAGAMVVGEHHACVRLTEAELASLVAAITGADVRAAAQRRLDRTVGRVEQVVVAHQLARRERAH